MDLDATVDEILEIDAERRRLTGQTEALKAEQNTASKQIPQLKKEGGDVAGLMARMKELSAKIKEEDAALSALEEKQKDLRSACPTCLIRIWKAAARRTTSPSVYSVNSRNSVSR